MQLQAPAQFAESATSYLNFFRFLQRLTSVRLHRVRMTVYAQTCWTLSSATVLWATWEQSVKQVRLRNFTQHGNLRIRLLDLIKLSNYCTCTYSVRTSANCWVYYWTLICFVKILTSVRLHRVRMTVYAQTCWTLSSVTVLWATWEQSVKPVCLVKSCDYIV